MKGRILMLKMMPYLNMLVKAQILTPAEMTAFNEGYMNAQDITPADIVAGLCALDVPDEKAYAFSRITESILNAGTEGGIFKNPLEGRNQGGI